ncbi:MAG TPA: phosphatidylglycerol lysyltransferase domain-containing protein [Chitinivibrionales bacterium]|nr:phosphatidylglycerol lysyltransferase domain-containing protein [Chitinivibrionales bacterium]
MIIEPLSLRHRELLYKPLKAIATAVSEYSFANLYLFRAKHDYKVIRNGEIFITGRAASGDTYVMPTRDVRLMPSETLDRMIQTYGMMFPVLEEWLPAFDAGKYRISFDEGESDYIHEIAKLASYSGNKLHGKKNLLNQFLKTYSSKALPLTDDRLADAMNVLDAWQRESRQPRADTDFAACSEALSLYEELVLCGGVYYVGDDPAGFIVGEELNEQMFALHFAKAKTAYRGIYQYMYHQFAQIMPAKYTAFNFEQDLGLESLRRAKASYYPEKMVRKYRVSKPA